MAAHFGEMLLERRRAMGMTIQQVANVIKIRPQIIEFFETENLAAMPPRGYAQGMISSYARYLGLNPRVVVDAYFDALNAYERGMGQSGSRYQEYVPDASPRSANATGRFMMLDSGPVSSRFAQRPPQAGYVSEGVSPHEPVAADQLRPLPAGSRGSARRAGASGYGNPGATGRMPRTDGRAPQTGARNGRSRGVSGGSGMPPQGRRGSMPPTGGYGDRGRNGGGAGVPPRSGSYGRGGRGGQVPPRRGSRSASQATAGFPFDSRLLIAVLAALVLVIVLLAFLLMRGCAPKPSVDSGSSAPKAQIADKKTDSDDSADDTDTGSDTTDDTDANAADGTDATDTGDGSTDGQDATDGDAAAQPVEETKVKVAIKEKGAVAFLEVKLDGKSVLGTQEVGPFEQEFTVTQQIEITTDKPSDVVVTKNGKKVRYDMKVSGVAKVTIVAPQPEPTADDATADGGDAQSADAANGSDGSDSTQQQ